MKTENHYTGSEVTEMLLKNHIFWDGRPCQLVNGYTLKSDRAFKMIVTVYQMTQFNILEDFYPKKAW